MVSNFPRLFVSAGESTPRAEQTRQAPQAPQADGFGERVLDRVREAFCGLHGHDSMLQFEQERMFLKCVSCGHESPGWELNEPAPTVVARVDHRLPSATTRHQIVGERRIA
jgi:hypothetical protein